MSADVKNKIKALIRRPFSDEEEDNFELYYDLAKVRLNLLLGGEVFTEFDEAEADLKILLVSIFNLYYQETLSRESVESKSIEGFSVKYKSKSQLFNDFLASNRLTIDKYKLNNRAKLRSGDTIYDGF